MRHQQAVLMLGFTLLPLVLAGCGGGGSNGAGSSLGRPTTQTLTGNTAVQAAIVSSYQAFQGGVNYPFAQVQATLPTGSTFKAALRAALAAAAQKRGAAHAVQTNHAGAAPDGLGLYTVSSTSGNTETLTAYTDAAQTQSAGTLTVTQTAPTVNAINLGAYTTYPVAFTITANLTAGPLPCTGQGSIALTDAAGAGEIKGAFALPSTHVSATADLTLSDAGAIGGTLMVMENAQTVTVTNLSGAISGDITGTVTVTPQNYTGTATLNIANDTFAVTLNTPTGTATGTGTSSGGLNITLPDGSSETVLSPLTADPTATITTVTGTGTGTSTGTGTGTGTGTAATYNTPVAIAILGPSAINANGQITGLDGTGIPLYLAGTTASLQHLGLYQGQNEAPEGINDSAEIIGFGFNQIANVTWAGPTATPMALSSGGIPFGINNGGEIVGYVGSSPIVWASASATPTGLALLSGDTTGTADAVNDAGLIVGTSGTSSLTHPVYWTGATAQPQALINVSGNPVYTKAGINAAGQLFEAAQYDATGATVFWQSPTAQPVTLPGLPGAGQANTATGGEGIGVDGTVVGSATNAASQQTAVLWKSGQITDLNTLIPSGSGWVLTSATAINAHGVIVGTGTYNGVASGYEITPLAAQIRR